MSSKTHPQVSKVQKAIDTLHEHIERQYSQPGKGVSLEVISMPDGSRHMQINTFDEADVENDDAEENAASDNEPEAASYSPAKKPH